MERNELIKTLAMTCKASYSFYAGEADCRCHHDIGWYYEVGCTHGGDTEAMKRGSWRPNDNTYGPFATEQEADKNKIEFCQD